MTENESTQVKVEETLNAASNNAPDEPQKTNGCLKLFLIFFIGTILLIIAVPVVFYMVDHIPRTKDTKSSGQYTVELQATSSPEWPFGPQDGRIVLKNDNKKISSVDFTLSNDGKSMCESNWKVDWNADSVFVTIIGEEQPDAHYTIYFNGEVAKSE